MSDTAQPAVHAERRIRTLLALLDPETCNLGEEIVYSSDFRSAEWPRNAYALTRADMEAVLGLLDQARSLRLEWPSIRAAVDPEVHTGARVVAYLEARGWVKEFDRRGGGVWQNVDLGRSVFVPMETGFEDWDKRMAELACSLAYAYDSGELGVLAAIAEAGDA